MDFRLEESKPDLTLPFLAFFGSWQLAQLFSRIGAMSALKAASWSTAAKAERRRGG